MPLVRETSTGDHYLEKIGTGADEGAIAAIQFYEKQDGSDGATGNTVFTLLTGEYIPDSYTLMVFVNGQKSELKAGAAAADEYTETSSTVITFGAGLQNADVVEFIVAGSYNVTDVDFVEDDAYGAGWNGDGAHAPSQNAVYDEIEKRAPKESPTFTTKITTPIIDLTGGQIAFPASQNASADANTLDDYEEGTWTLGINCSIGGSVTLNSSYDLCSYTKIGRVVHVQGMVVVSSVSSPNGTLEFSLPFVVANLNEYAGWSAGTFGSYNTIKVGDYSISVAEEGAAYFIVRGIRDNAAWSPLTAAYINGDEWFIFQLTYFIA